MSASKIIIIIIINCVTEMYERTGKTRIVYSKDVFSMAKPDIINYITDL
jgi:hypothetical protein